MFPRWHFLFGLAFAAIIFIVAPSINLFNFALLFAASFLIDFDHYLAYLIKEKKAGLFGALKYHRELDKAEQIAKQKGKTLPINFHLFHTIEFHALIGILGIVLWNGFFYMFLGMMFHSLLDFADMAYRGRLDRREYFFFNWLKNKF